MSDVNPGFMGSSPTALLGLADDGIFLFAANDGVHGRELWATRGEGDSTWLVADLAPGPRWSSPRRGVRFGDVVLFAAFDGAGLALWQVPVAGITQ